MPQKVLFMVGSMYQLINAITLRMTEWQDDDCDLVLRSSSKWNEEVLERLRQENVFGQIFCPDLTKQEESFWYLPMEERHQLMNEPLRFFGEAPVEPVYDVLLLGVAHISWRLIYRYHRLCDKQPKVYFFDEGIRSYTFDQLKYEDTPYLQNDYQQTRLTDAAAGYYLYRPDWYSVPEHNFTLLQMPKPNEHEHVKQALLTIFGRASLPEEPYIYLEDFFFVDRHVSNDFELFTQVAEIVGKENIAVKCHPRNTCDRFAPHGYHSIENSIVPWEIQLLSNDLTGKVLISVSSTSIMSPFFIFGARMHIISLERMFVGDNPLHADKPFTTYFNKFIESANEKDTIVHLPRNVVELKETLRYIKLLTNEQTKTVEG